MTNYIPNSLIDFKDFIEKTDDDGVLQIYSYKHCTNESEDSLKKCRGLVYHDDVLVAKSLGFTTEYNENTNLNEMFNTESVDNYNFYKSEEGTLIRVFCYEDKWYISTHRKLDAFKSRWSSNSSFGEIFENCLKKIYQDQENPLSVLTSSLDKKNIYFFLIRNTSENRIVSKSPEDPKVYFVGYFNGESYLNELPEHLNSFPVQISFSFSTWEELTEHVKNVDPFEYQGVICFKKNSDKHFKVLNSKYQAYAQVRGNESNLLLRYLNLRDNPHMNKLFQELYPEHTSTFSNYEFIINLISKDIHTAYMSRFIGKKHVVVSHEAYQIVKECHGWHISDRVKNKVTYNHVLSVLTQQRFANVLYSLIKNYKANGKV